jgi:hypothetical protein
MEKAWQERCEMSKFQSINAAYDLLAKGLGLPLRVNHEELLNSFESLGLEGLANNNRLSRKDNQRLADSQDIHEIVSLVVRGLAACASLRSGLTTKVVSHDPQVGWIR